MNKPEDKLNRLWQRARTAPRTAEAADEPLPPGTAVRVAARWAGSGESAAFARAWERVTLCCLAPTLAAWAVVAWMHPAPQESDLLEVLFTAKFERASSYPF